jgi:hypothetical protein
MLSGLCLLLGTTAIAQRATRMRAGTDSIQGLQARIFETEEEIRRLDTSRVHGEVECARLQRALAMLCAAHNQLSPLYRLPDELLARIGAFVIYTEYPSPQPLHLPILAVFSRFRAALLSTPEIWFHVRADSGSWARSFLRNAAAHPVHVLAHVWTSQCTLRVANYEQNITSLEINGLLLLIEKASKPPYSSCGRRSVGWHLITDDHQERWDRREWSEMLLLWISVMVDLPRTLCRIPNMPRLRTLHLSHTKYSLPDLHAFLCHSPGLEVVIFDSIVGQIAHFEPEIDSYTKITLPSLKRVHICGMVGTVSDLLHILPYPDTQLRVAVECSDENFSETLLQALANILAQIDQFWAIVSPGSDVLCLAIDSRCRYIEPDDLDKRVFLTCEAGPCWIEGSTAPSVHFHAQCCVETAHPIFARVSRVVLGAGLDTHMLGQTIEGTRLDLSNLSNVTSLHFHHVHFTRATAEGSAVIVNLCMRVLRDAHPTQPLRVVAFHDCVDEVGFFRRLKADGNAERFFWTK